MAGFIRQTFLGRSFPGMQQYSDSGLGTISQYWALIEKRHFPWCENRLKISLFCTKRHMFRGHFFGDPAGCDGKPLHQLAELP